MSTHDIASDAFSTFKVSLQIVLESEDLYASFNYVEMSTFSTFKVSSQKVC